MVSVTAQTCSHYVSCRRSRSQVKHCLAEGRRRNTHIMMSCRWFLLSRLACVANTLTGADHDEQGHALVLKATKFGPDRPETS